MLSELQWPALMLLLYSFCDACSSVFEGIGFEPSQIGAKGRWAGSASQNGKVFSVGKAIIAL